jgi:putative transcriptional regulator
VSIRINLDRVLFDRRMTLTELSERVGVTIVNLSVLKTNKAKAIRFSTLAAICKELECQPGDILEYVTDQADESGGGQSSGIVERKGGAAHPMAETEEARWQR